MEGDDEEFKALINKYGVLSNSLEGDSDEIISSLYQPELVTSGSSNGSLLSTVPKEVSMIHDLRSVQQLQKEIYKLDTTIQENILRKEQEPLETLAFLYTKEIIENVQYVVENKSHIQKILNTQIGENSPPIPRHLHKQTVEFFKMIAHICNNYDHIADTFSKADSIDFNDALRKLSEVVYDKDFNTMKQEMDTVDQYLALLMKMSVNEGEESQVTPPAYYQMSL